MASALLKPCAHPGGCPELVESGCCPAHQRAREARRGSAHSRGYTAAWRAFRGRVTERMVALDIVPVCGARLPGAPTTGDSRCQAAGLLNPRHLHLDHTPPLLDIERADERAVCDPMRVQWLCEACHNAKSQRERQQGLT
jgi:hypothetical protein